MPTNGVEPDRAHESAPCQRANHQPAILEHDIVACPNVLPALAGVRIRALMYGQAPRIDDNCNVIGKFNDTLEFSYMN
jgi:hypothetical protein